MNVTATIDRLKPAIQEMVRLTLTDIDHLSASNIALTMLAFNFLGDGLRDALDPQNTR